MDFAGGLVTIHDMAALKKVADFDPSYLYLDRQQR